MTKPNLGYQEWKTKRNSKIMELWKKGESVSSISKNEAIGRSTIYRVIREETGSKDRRCREIKRSKKRIYVEPHISLRYGKYHATFRRRSMMTSVEKTFDTIDQARQFVKEFTNRHPI